MGNRHVKTEEEQTKHLNLYFKNLLETKLEFRRSEEEVRDIQYAVTDLVDRIASTVGELDNSLKIERVVSVGSMKEGTKIKEPDEFDFLLVLGLPSKPGSVATECEKKNGRGYKHLMVKDENLKFQWRHCMYGNVLKGTIRSKLSYFFNWLFGYDIGLRQVLYKTFCQVVESVRNKNRTCYTSTGIMVLGRTLNRHGPAFTSVVYWTPFDKNSTSLVINVDLTPAIQLEFSEEILEESEVYDQRFYKALKSTNRVMALPCNRASSCKNGLCFRLTFTETEVQLLGSNTEELSCQPPLPDKTSRFANSVRKHHIQCFKVMKYIFECDSVHTIEVFKSYTLKTFLLKHMCLCEREENIASCVLELVNDCLQAMRSFKGSRLNISSIFVTEQNIFHKKIISSPRDHFITAIENLKKSLDKIGKAKDYRRESLKKVNKTVRHLRELDNTI